MKIKFNYENTGYYLKLGVIDLEKPLERKFKGGDVIEVKDITANKLNDECVDIIFADGEFAIEVPREFFTIIEADHETA